MGFGKLIGGFGWVARWDDEGMMGSSGCRVLAVRQLISDFSSHRFPYCVTIEKPSVLKYQLFLN